MPSDELFGPIFLTNEARDLLADDALFQAFLDVEVALARAQADEGVIPTGAAEAIIAAARPSRFDVAEIGRRGAASGNPIVPLVDALLAVVDPASRPYVHHGTTSQDILDTGLMLVAGRTLRLAVVELERARTACRNLARKHAADVMLGRTLLQPAVPTTFGLKAAGWLSGLTAVRRRLAEVATHGPAVQLGGPAGTFGGLDDRGAAVARRMGERLGLAVPVLPWHTQRVRVAEMGATLAVVAGALEKVALDVELLAQAEVAEVALYATGGSSVMPHKQNPVGCVVVRADAASVRGAAGVLLAGMAQEHERGAGPWHAEWHALRDALGFTIGAAAELAGVLEGLTVDPARMRANLDAQHGLPMATYAASALTEAFGRSEAHELVRDASRRATSEGRELADVLAETGIELAGVLDPDRLVPGLQALVDRALADDEAG